MRTRWFLLAGLLVALVLAGVVSTLTSGSPDGLDSALLDGCTTNADGQITGGECLAQREADNQTGDSPLAGYGIRGIDNPYLSTGLAGAIGVLVTLGLGFGLLHLARRRKVDSGDAVPGR